MDSERSEMAKIGGVGSLVPEDLVDFRSARRRIHEYMRTAGWCTEDDIVRIGGQRQAMRRMRELRAAGATIEVRRRDDLGKRHYEYRMEHPATKELK